MSTAVLSREEEKQSAQEKKPRSHKLPLGAEELKKIDAYWRAANYLSVTTGLIVTSSEIYRKETSRHVLR